MNSAAAKNLAMELAKGGYKGLKSIGRSIRKAPGRVMDKIERVDRLKQERHQRIKEENFGPDR